MGRDDLRIIKTLKVLNTAMVSLLGRYNFGKITVSDICEEALISRAAFYSHFADKYDFLKSWLIYIKPDIVSKDDAYEKAEKILNDFIYENKLIIKNLIYDAGSETLGILSEFMLCILFTPDEHKSTIRDPKHIVFSNFFAGGMLSYVLWQVQNRFPSDMALVNVHLYEIVKMFREWEAELD